MFTGLIRHLGTLQARQPRTGGARLVIAALPELLERAEEGASICTNGACLTAVSRDGRTWQADLSDETLARTTLGRLAPGAVLHLEPSLQVGDPLDGHLVSGHVDGVGRLLERAHGEGIWRFSMPEALAPMTAPKGSIAVDGLSLTVVDCGTDWFTVALIPETVRRTRLEKMAPGTEVNLEGDPVGRFVARALSLRASDEKLQRFAQGGWGVGMVKTRGPREIAPDLLERLRARFGGFPLTKDWGLCIQEVGPGRALLAMAPSAATTNGPSGVLNGGVLATLADMACAFALSTLFDGRMPFATSDLHIRYLEPADGPVAIEATVIRASLRSAVMECRILCEDRVMALCTAHFIIKARTGEQP